MIIHDRQGQPITKTNSTTGSGWSGDSFNFSVSSSNATTPVSLKAATASKSIYITDLIITSGIINKVTLQDEDGIVILSSLNVAANGSLILTGLNTPFKVASGKGLKVKTTFQGQISVSASGFVL